MKWFGLLVVFAMGVCVGLLVSNRPQSLAATRTIRVPQAERIVVSQPSASSPGGHVAYLLHVQDRGVKPPPSADRCGNQWLITFFPDADNATCVTYEATE